MWRRRKVHPHSSEFFLSSPRSYADDETELSHLMPASQAVPRRQTKGTLCLPPPSHWEGWRTYTRIHTRAHARTRRLYIDGFKPTRIQNMLHTITFRKMFRRCQRKKVTIGCCHVNLHLCVKVVPARECVHVLRLT